MKIFCLCYTYALIQPLACCYLVSKSAKNCEIKKIQNTSLSNEDRKEQLRQIYIKKIGPITKDEFTGFMMKPDFLDFIKSIISFGELVFSISSTNS